MTTRPLILDTTFVLPLFGIDVDLSKGYSPLLIHLWKKGIPGFRLILPTSCLVEVYYKLNKEFKRKQDKSVLDRYSVALPTVVTSKVVNLFDPISNHECAEAAAAIRNAGHPDVLDCFIAATAITLKGSFLTEDGDLKALLKKESLLPSNDMLGWKEIQKIIEQLPEGK
nr:PIN domain-containing protein [Candidatus Sigynarchaeota archaeon]